MLYFQRPDRFARFAVSGGFAVKRVGLPDRRRSIGGIHPRLRGGGPSMLPEPTVPPSLMALLEKLGAGWQHDGAAKGPRPVGRGTCFVVLGLLDARVRARLTRRLVLA